MEKLILKDGEIIEETDIKGLTDSVRKQQLAVEKIEDCLQKHTKHSVTQHTIRSDHHKLYSCEMKKIGLSAANDKRWIHDDGISTYAHGHYKTRKFI